MAFEQSINQFIRELSQAYARLSEIYLGLPDDTLSQIVH